MSKGRQAYQVKRTDAEQEHLERLAILVDAYEAIRDIRGRARDVAYRQLALALAQSCEPFHHRGWVYRWSWSEDSITRRRSSFQRVVRDDPPLMSGAETLSQSARRQIGRGKVFGGWSMKGRAI